SLSIWAPILGIPKFHITPVICDKPARWQRRSSRACVAWPTIRCRGYAGLRRSSHRKQFAFHRLEFRRVSSEPRWCAAESYDFLLDMTDSIFRVRMITEELAGPAFAFSLDLLEEFDHRVRIVAAVI